MTTVTENKNTTDKISSSKKPFKVGRSYAVIPTALALSKKEVMEVVDLGMKKFVSKMEGRNNQ